MGWLIALAIIVFILCLPLGASVKYNSDGVLVRILAGPVPVTVYPATKKKPEKEKQSKEKTSIKSAKPSKKHAQPLPEPEKPKEETGGSLLDFLPLVQTALDFLADFPRILRVRRLEAKVILAGDDPCDLATNYGRTWAALGNLWPRLEEIFIIQKRNVQLECDFTATQTLILARLDVTLTLGRTLALLIRYGLRALKQYLNIKKSRKGGAAI